MKKFFFFRSTTSKNGDKSPTSQDKQVYWEKKNIIDSEPLNNQPARNSRNKHLISDSSNSGTTSPCLRRSLSFSSGNARDRKFHLTRFTNQDNSPCSTSNVSLKQPNHHSSRQHTPTPESQSKAKWFEDVAGQNFSSESSSNCSSSLSNKALDRFIDDEHHKEESRIPKTNYSHWNGVQSGVKQRPRSHSFREPTGNQPYVSTQDWVENGFGHGSPRELAKHVIERLSQSHIVPRENSKELNPIDPITVEDIYSNRHHSLDSNGISHINSEDDHDETGDDSSRVEELVEPDADLDVELFKKSKAAEERAMFLSEELEQEIFLHNGGFSSPALVQTIRNLTEERVNLALEVSNVLQDRMAERLSAKEDLRLVKAKLEKEKNELQSALEKEMDRRSSELSFKLEKYQMEENRLRERARELAEKNVLLQREITSVSEREMQLKDLSVKAEESQDENRNLHQNVSELRDNIRVIEEERDSFQKSFQEKEKECKELHKSVARLVRTCSEQEKMIEGLREGLGEEIRNKNSDNRLGKLQLEQARLIGVEQGLRKEVESYRHEVGYLRQENTDLLDRLRDGVSSFKLDQELRNRIGCCQDQGCSLLNESVKLCMKLLEYIKTNETCSLGSKEGIEEIKNSLNGQFIIESDMKIQGLKHKAENLERSLHSLSTVLNEKSNMYTSSQPNDRIQNTEEKLQSELKAESLLTSLLREKLYSKVLEFEQLQAELSAAVRSNDIIRCELHNAMDMVSCMTHKMKDVGVQTIKKDENINQMQNELQECKKELGIVRGILSKVSEERDLMWEEVKQYSEKTMLLNCEISRLKKKIEALDEDILLKEGQITILRDTIRKPFDLLASPDSAQERFLLDC